MNSRTPIERVPKVGDPVWIFDANHRVYRKGPDGRALSGGPIWREHWVKQEVTGETSRSWIVGKGYGVQKIPKKGPPPWGVCWTEEQIDRRAFISDHAHHISDAVRRVHDYDTLKKIADLLGYVADK